MKLTLNETPEREIWNEFLIKTESGHPFQTFKWGDFKKMQGWKSRRIALEDSSGSIKSVLSILEKKIPLFGFKIWYLPRGPVLDFQDKELVEETVDFLIDFAKKNKVMVVKISPDVVLEESTKWIPELLKNEGFRETADYQLHKCTIRIDLRDGLDVIMSKFKKNTRWEIKRAETILGKIKTGENENDLKDFYRLYSEAMGRDRLPYDYFKNLWEFFKKNVFVLISFHKNRPVSAGFVACFNKRCFYLFGGSSKKYSTYYASQLLQWEAIRRSKERGAEVYDLQGIPCGEPKTPHDKGVLQFKEGFGGERIELIGEFDYVFSPTLFKILRKLNQAKIMTKGMIGRV